MRYAWLVGILLVVGGAPGFAETGRAAIKGTAEGSAITGVAMLVEIPSGLKVIVQVANVPPGKHGLHIHRYGSCAEQGNGAGGHYNPAGVKHGFLPTDGFAGAHAGDFGNLEVNENGLGALELTIPDLTISQGPHPVAGRAIVLHEKPDDFGQPTGNAGGRIGCGPIVITSE